MPLFKKLSSIFGNPKFRVIFLLILFIALIVAGIIYWRSKKTETVAVSLARVPAIKTLPGVGNATEEYIKKVQEADKAALEKASILEGGVGAAVPTITRAGFKGPVSGFQAPASTAPKKECEPEALKRAKEAGVTAEELRCLGCTIAQLRAAGYTAGELRNAGFSAPDLKAAGFTADELREAGFNAKELKDAGFTAKDLKAAGFGAQALKEAGFGAKDLMDAGYTAKELKDAGFTAKDLKAMGAPVSDLKAAGFDANDLKDAGFSAADLKAAGFNADELQAAGFAGLKPVKAGCSVEDLARARKQGISAEQLKKDRNCDVAAMKAAGFTAAELKNAGYSPKELADAGFTAKELKAAGFSPQELKVAGFTAKELTDAGFTPAQLKTAGYSAKELKDAGFSPKRLLDAGFNPKELKDAGFTAKDLSDIGLTAKQLKDAGFTPEDLKAAGFSAADLRDAGFTPEELKTGGYTEGDLIRAGFTPEEVGLVKPTIQPVVKQQLSPAETGKSALAAKQLKDAGVDAKQLRKAGFGAAPLRDAGFNAAQLKGAGFTDDELAQAGFSPAEIMAASGMAQFGQLQVEEGLPPPTMQPQQALPSLAAAEREAGNKGLNDRAAALLAQVNKQREIEVAAEQQQDFLNQIQSAMAGQAAEMIASWAPPPGQQYVAGVATQKSEKTGGAAGVGPEGFPGVAEKSAAELQALNALNIKAGDIMFAVLETGINSDEQSPIMAKIVDGPLKGARLLGRFDRVKERVVLSFSLMSLPWLPKSVSMNAVAIDPDTAKTALAHHVDSHFLLRYGGLFAASFLSGLATAISESGSTIEAVGLFPQKSMPILSSGQKALVALGEVGTQFSSVLREKVNTPPTVEVFQGSGIGVLFMSDLSVPKKPQKNRADLSVSKSVRKAQEAYENGYYRNDDDF